LKDIADKTVGTYSHYNDADKLVAGLDLKPEVREEIRKNELIQWPGMIFICLALLTAEWMIRRKIGLK